MNNEQEKEYALLKENVRAAMQNKAARVVLWKILEMADVYRISGPDDPRFYEGRRSVGVDILGLLDDADPLLYPKLILELQDETE